MSDLYSEFVSGVKEHHTPSCLEEIRSQIYQEWKEGEQIACVSESDAVSMAIGHNHEDYIEYLLEKNPETAMRTSGFSCSHLARAVESDRPAIVRRLLRHSLRIGPEEQRCRVSTQRDKFKRRASKKLVGSSYLNKPSGCMLSGPSKTAVHLACELGRAACLAELLHHGATPTPKDISGLTPLDHALRKLCNGDQKTTTPSDIAQALRELVPFLPVVQADPETLELVEKCAKRTDTSTELKKILTWVLGDLKNPRALQQVCKYTIRAHITRANTEPVSQGVFQLPLPKLIKTYLFAPVSTN